MQKNKRRVLTRLFDYTFANLTTRGVFADGGVSSGVAGL